MLSMDPDGTYGIRLSGEAKDAFLAAGEIEPHEDPVVRFRWRSVRADLALQAVNEAITALGDTAAEQTEIVDLMAPQLAAHLAGWQGIGRVTRLPDRRYVDGETSLRLADAAVNELLGAIGRDDLGRLWARLVVGESLAVAAAERFSSSPSAPGTATGQTPDRANPSASIAPTAAENPSPPTEPPAPPAAEPASSN